jgi:hypothetical protein
MHNFDRRILVACGVWLVSATASSHAVFSQEKPDAKKVEYCDRLAKIPPRSAEAYADLGEWCRASGLETEAAACFAKAIAIDEDCEKARTALSFRRYGTGWVKQDEKVSGFTRPASSSLRATGVTEEAPRVEPAPSATAGARSPAPAAASASAAPATAAPSAAAAPTPAPTAGGESATTPATSTPETTVQKPPKTATGTSAAKKDDEFAAAVEKKKQWAKTAEGKLQATFNTYEDADFLVHSTLPTSAREVKVLVLYLKGVRKVLAKILGASGSTRIWPDKAQFVLLKSEPEYERFAKMVDSIASAKNPDGAYTAGEHTALFNPESDAVPRFLGKTALRRLNGSTKWVGWWLEEGVSELSFCQTPAGQKKEHYATSMKYAAEVMKADGEALKIFNLLETASYRDRDATKSQALALSLVDFLYRKNSGFQDLVKTLKGADAPEPPGPDAKKEEFDSFHVSFISFQEKTMEATFHTQLSTLQEKWKAYTQAVAESIKAQESAKAKEESAKEKKAKGAKGGKKGG